MHDDPLNVQPAASSDVDRVVAIWHEGWHDAHDSIVHESLCRLRTHESFRERLLFELRTTRVISAAGVPLGFAMIRGSELHQFYIAASARGTGAASLLLKTMEAQMMASGERTAWLSCAVGNLRAARFYQKAGWVRVATVTTLVETQAGPVPIDFWRYEKELT